MSEQDNNFDYWDSVEQWPGSLRGDCQWPWRRCLRIWACCWSGTTLGCLSSKHPPSIDDVDGITRRLSVMRCALAQPKESDDGYWFTVFQTSTKISDKNYRVIIDSGSCVNVVATNIMTKFGWRLLPIPNHTSVFGWTLHPLTLMKNILSRSNLPLTRTNFGVT